MFWNNIKINNNNNNLYNTSLNTSTSVRNSLNFEEGMRKKNDYYQGENSDSFQLLPSFSFLPVLLLHSSMLSSVIEFC